MSCCDYLGNSLHVGKVPVAEIVREYGTPLFIYSRAALEQGFSAYQRALAGQQHLICFAVKANSNLAVLDTLKRLGCGFDIVSGGELSRVLAVGSPPEKIIFSGLGKTAAEMQAALVAGIGCFNVESAAELEWLAAIAADTGRQAPVSIRVNPDVDGATHPHVSTGLRDSKFGIPIAAARQVYQRAQAMPSVKIVGISCHIGSQITSAAPFVEAVSKLLELADELAANGVGISLLDIGGGLGIRYREERPPPPDEYLQPILALVKGRDLTLIVEPGRSIAGNAGLFVVKVEYLKHNGHKHFAVVDGAMNDLLRPALYGAWQEIVPVRRRAGASLDYDVVGPVCESADSLGKNRRLSLRQGDLLAVKAAGAYGFVMSSNYNSRPRAAEVMVDGDQTRLIRRRELVSDLTELESPLLATRQDR